MAYTTVAVYPETKRLMSDYVKANPEIRSYDGMINHLLKRSRNAGRIAESGQRALDIFDLFIKQYPAFWGTFETEFFEKVSHDKLKKYLKMSRARKSPESKREAVKAYARLKGPILEEFVVKKKRSRQGKS